MVACLAEREVVGPTRPDNCPKTASALSTQKKSTVRNILNTVASTQE